MRYIHVVVYTWRALIGLERLFKRCGVKKAAFTVLRGVVNGRHTSCQLVGIDVESGRSDAEEVKEIIARRLRGVVGGREDGAARAAEEVIVFRGRRRAARPARTSRGVVFTDAAAAAREPPMTTKIPLVVTSVVRREGGAVRIRSGAADGRGGGGRGNDDAEPPPTRGGVGISLRGQRGRDATCTPPPHH